jgi:hypothetical protein
LNAGIGIEPVTLFLPAFLEGPHAAMAIDNAVATSKVFSVFISSNIFLAE